MEEHHARLFFVPDVETFSPTISSNVEYREEFFDRISIDTARSLIRSAWLTADQKEGRVFCVKTKQIMIEAQHALLKLLEEPPQEARFIFVLPTGSNLLPTLLSRFSVEEVSVEDKPTSAFDDFIQLTVKDRLTEIEKRIKAKDLEWQGSLKIGLLTWIAQPTTDRDLQVVKALELVASRLLTRGASNKMLLEHLALSIPTRS